MGGRARALDRRLRPTCHLHQHLERFDGGLLTDVAASDRAKAIFTLIDAPVTSGHSNVHEANGLARRGTARSGDASD
jgi:hypothetical protein